MNDYLLLFLLLIFSLVDRAQNVSIGIGTNNPQAKLDVAGSIRVGGINRNSSYLSYDSASGNFIWNNSFLFVPTNQALIRHSGSLEGLYYNNAQLEYHDAFGTSQFSTNWATGNGYIGGNLGIGRANPGSPLHFASLLDEKIILWNNIGSNYGIGIQSSQLQIHTDINAASIVLGYGSSTNFTENMRISGNGRVGIGTNDPQATLDVRKGSQNASTGFFSSNSGSPDNSYFNFGVSENTYVRGSKIILNDIPGGKVGVGIEPFIYDGPFEVGGRMLIRGAVGTEAGTSLNRAGNSGIVAFIGLEDDNWVGFTGISLNPTLTKFSMNTQTGALKLSGISGIAGEVLQSGFPHWVSPTRSLAVNLDTVNARSTTTIINNAGPVDITRLLTLFIDGSNAKVLVRYMLQAAHSCEFCGPNYVYIDVVFDGVLISRNVHDNINITNGSNGMNGTLLIPTVAGTHTVKLMASCKGYNTYIGSGDHAGLFIQVLEQ